MEEILENIKKQSQEFFDLPVEEKNRWAQKPGCLEGYGHAFVTSEHQKLEWNDMLFLKVFPEQNRKLGFWPENPQNFRLYQTIVTHKNNYLISRGSLMGNEYIWEFKNLHKSHSFRFLKISLS